MERKCLLCGATLSQYNPGRYCFPCQKKQIEAFDADSPHYDLEDMCNLLGLQHTESVKRLQRKGKIPGRVPGVREHKYFKTVVDEWIKKEGKITGDEGNTMGAPRLKHNDALAELAKQLTHVQQLLLSYGKGEPIIVTEDSWGMFHFQPPKNAPIPSPTMSYLEVIDSEEASYFFEHFVDEFPKIGLSSWKDLLRQKLPPNVTDKLKYWSNTADFRPCHTCQVCRDLRL